MYKFCVINPQKSSANQWFNFFGSLTIPVVGHWSGARDGNEEVIFNRSLIQKNIMNLMLHGAKRNKINKLIQFGD